MMAKKILTLLLCLVMTVTLLASCNGDGEVTDTDNGDSSDGTEQTEGGNIFADLEAEFSVICPDREESYFNPIILRFTDAVFSNTGVALTPSTDFTKENTDGGLKTDACEVLIGDTNRYESVITECSENSFVIKTVGNKIVIKGSSRYYTIAGALYFIDNCIGSKDSGVLFKVDAETSVTESPENSAAMYVDIAKKTEVKYNTYTSSSDNTAFTKSGTVTVKEVALEAKKAMSFDNRADSKGALTIGGMQGGCTDGEYFYVLLTNPGDGGKGASNEDETRVIKIDPKTLHVVKEGPIISVAHSNDLTYDSKRNKLIVPWCSVDSYKVSFIDPETLKVTSSDTITGSEQGIFALAYNQAENNFVASESSYAKNGCGMYVFNSKLRFEKRLDGISLGYTAQGIYCDSEYIYYTLSPNSKVAGLKTQNVINVFDWDGNYVCTLTVDLPHEIEHVFWYDNSFWAGFNANNTAELYQLTFKL